MTSESTWAQSKAMAPAARRHRADTSEAVKPRDWGPRAVTAVRRVALMSVGVTADQAPS